MRVCSSSRPLAADSDIAVRETQRDVRNASPRARGAAQARLVVEARPGNLRWSHRCTIVAISGGTHGANFCSCSGGVEQITTMSSPRVVV
ncbi:hypothetical protein WMF26_32060 [Sorangium sp. So ce185]|uniref:hypothetical protein n=1 Tax=Sorangium sp. So ce185 TaxID=3133287 RepID=UPI003F603426